MNSPSSRGISEIRVSIALSALAAVALVLRFVARLRRTSKIELDDWFALAGLIGIGAMLIEEILWATIGGSGKHIDNLSPDQIETFLKIFLSNEFTYSITSPVIKISVVLFYRRIFTTHSFRLAANAVILMITLWGVATFLAAALQCRPLKAYWDITIHGQCFDALKYVLGVQGVNIFLDLVILCLPMKMVWGLRRPWQERLALAGVFLLGGFVVFASIYRIITLLWIEDSDITYTTYHGAIWTFVEPCIGLVCSCLPTIRGLFPAYRVGGTVKVSKSESKLKSWQNPGDSYNGHLQYLRMDDLTSTSNVYSEDRVDGEDRTPDKIRVRTTVEVI